MSLKEQNTQLLAIALDNEFNCVLTRFNKLMGDTKHRSTLVRWFGLHQQVSGSLFSAVATNGAQANAWPEEESRLK